MTPEKIIANLTTLIRKRVPGVLVSVDRPARVFGRWFVDVKNGAGQSLTVEFLPRLSLFGLSSPSDGFGEKPDESHETSALLVQRIARLFRSKSRTVPGGHRRTAASSRVGHDHADTRSRR